jgi:hypothetical protein
VFVVLDPGFGGGSVGMSGGRFCRYAIREIGFAILGIKPSAVNDGN